MDQVHQDKEGAVEGPLLSTFGEIFWGITLKNVNSSWHEAEGMYHCHLEAQKMMEFQSPQTWNFQSIYCGKDRGDTDLDNEEEAHSTCLFYYYF